MTTIVLGWDGLDYELAQQFGVADAFGDEMHRIRTIINDELNKPHTWELWPSMITGKAPDDHGIHADEYIESGWSNPLLRVAESLSQPIPDSLRWRIGRWIRDAGAEMAFESLEYYEDTVFDGYRALPIAVPNARSQYDEAVGMEQDRGAYLADYLDSGGDGGTRKATVPTDVLRGRVAGDAGSKVAMIRELQDQYDLVWVWLAYLDTLGHVAPTVADPEHIQQRAYEHAAGLTQDVRAALDSDDTLLCVSDHGLQDGQHTMHAAVSGPASAVRGVGSVLNVREAVERVTDASMGDSRRAVQQETDEVRERLEDLGYV